MQGMVSYGQMKLRSKDPTTLGTGDGAGTSGHSICRMKTILIGAAVWQLAPVRYSTVLFFPVNKVCRFEREMQGLVGFGASCRLR